jgi:23S rRNA (guanosine2251-2'-O)-methyltransferase
VRRLCLTAGGTRGERIQEILQAAAEAGIPVETVEREFFRDIPGRHGGVVVDAAPYPWVGLDEVEQKVLASARASLLLVLDVIQDPQNLGTLLRTADAVGVDGVVLPLRRGAEITPAVVSASAGASEHLWIARTNLAQALVRLKECGVWILGLDDDPTQPPLRSVDLTLPLALVVGNEGEGMRRLVRDRCDWVVRLPARGAVDSLNAAVAGSIALYAAWEARNDAAPDLESRPWPGQQPDVRS